MQEPRRLWRRYLVTNTLFALMLVRERIHRQPAYARTPVVPGQRVEVRRVEVRPTGRHAGPVDLGGHVIPGQRSSDVTTRRSVDAGTSEREAPMRDVFTGRIAVIGLGYIGLPTAVALATRGVEVIGVDVNPRHRGGRLAR